MVFKVGCDSQQAATMVSAGSQREEVQAELVTGNEGGSGYTFGRSFLEFEFSLLSHCLICIRCFHVVIFFTRAPRGQKTAQERSFSHDNYQSTDNEWKSHSKEGGPL